MTLSRNGGCRWRLAFVFVGWVSVLGQTSPELSVTKAPGEQVALMVWTDSQRARAPVALKWDVVFPTQLMDMETDATKIGSAAMNSGKSLQCAPRKEYVFVCTLSGGQNPIANGLIATFHFKIKATAKAATTTLRIENAEATTVDSKKWTLNATEAFVTIR